MSCASEAGSEHSQPAPKKFTSSISIIFGFIFIVAFGLRVYSLEDERLWTDEVFAATFAVQPLLELLIANLRFDAHPPLYHLQLHLWALISQSTYWLYLNSVAWSLAALLALYRCSREFLSPAAVLIATLLFAVMPVGVEWAHNLRMYGMLGFASILIWCFCCRFFTREHFHRSGLILAILLLVIVYAHVAGLVVLCYVGIYSSSLIFQTRPDRARIWWWVKMCCVLGLLTIPAAINVFVRDIGFSAPFPTPDVLMESLVYLIAGPARGGWVYLVFLTLSIFIVIGLRADPKIRALLLAFVVSPVALGVIVSIVVQPVWATRMLFVAPPVIAIAAARGIVETGRLLSPPRAVQISFSFATILAIGLGAAGLWMVENHRKPTDYYAAAQEIRSGLKEGDVVLAPEVEAFWGLAWYLIGPNWGSPLKVQDPSPESVSEKWTRILDWLGPVWRDRLHLEPRTRLVSYEGINLILGLSPSPIIANAKRVWLANYKNNRHPYVRLPGFEEATRTDFGSLTVHFLTASTAND